MSTIYLRKSGDDVISHCKCGDGRITGPYQLDCPWCGCGWMFSCITCRKAFTFAEGVEVDSTLKELMAEDRRGYLGHEPDPEEVKERAEVMEILLRGVKLGERYVYLDGYYLPAASRDVELQGWHSRHRFEILPQFAALDDKEILKKTIYNRDYWKSTAVPDTSE